MGGHGLVADMVTARFLRSFRHPGESYIDYVALLDSIYLRQQQIFKQELWHHFQRVCQSIQSCVQRHCREHSLVQLEFHDLASLLLRFVRAYLVAPPILGTGSAPAEDV